MTESNSIDQTHGSGDPSIPAKRRPRAGPVLDVSAVDHGGSGRDVHRLGAVEVVAAERRGHHTVG